jgi:hypothetical protein
MKSEIDLASMTELEIFDLSQKIKQELSDRPNRDKVRVFKVFVPFQFNSTFLSENNAKKFLSENLLDGTIDIDQNDDKSLITIGVYFVDKSSIQFCEDYKELIP